MNRGRFITLEGGEGVGKSTQACMLVAHLEKMGISVDLTREPGGTSGAEAIRTLLLDPESAGWNVRAEALLFAAARADHVARRIEPALAAGTWVICDRFLDSSRAYQGGGGGLSDADLLELHRVGSAGLLPDRTLLIEVPPDVAAARLAKRDGGAADAIGGRSAAYHDRVARAFRQLAEQEPGRFCQIDGSGPVDGIHARICAAIAPLLDRQA